VTAPIKATSTPAPTPPFVVGVQSVRKRRRGLTAVVVTFSEAMDPVRASNLGAYSLTTWSRGRHPRPVPVGISSASFNPQTNAVTLNLFRPLARGSLNLAIAGGTVAGQNGAVLTSSFSAPVE
jgi:hypothetical protein